MLNQRTEEQAKIDAAIVARRVRAAFGPNSKVTIAAWFARICPQLTADIIAVCNVVDPPTDWVAKSEVKAGERPKPPWKTLPGHNSGCTCKLCQQIN